MRFEIPRPMCDQYESLLRITEGHQRILRVSAGRDPHGAEHACRRTSRTAPSNSPLAVRRLLCPATAGSLLTLRFQAVDQPCNLLGPLAFGRNLAIVSPRRQQQVRPDPD